MKKFYTNREEIYPTIMHFFKFVTLLDKNYKLLQKISQQLIDNLLKKIIRTKAFILIVSHYYLKNV